MAAPTVLKEGRLNEGAEARAGAAGADPELADAAVDAGHPGAGVVVEGAVLNEAPVNVGPAAAVAVEALVPNPANVAAVADAGADAGAVELVVANPDNENDAVGASTGKGGAAPTGAEGAAPTAPKPPKPPKVT